MADTRCVNPEYQLEVDVMVIDYSLHKAIESTISTVRLQINSLRNSDDEPVSGSATEEVQQQSARLQQNASILLNLFRHNHGTAQLTDSISFCSKLLDFLILLSHYVPRGARARHGDGGHRQQFSLGYGSGATHQHLDALPTTIVQQSQQQRVLNTVLRRNWLSLCHGNEPRARYDVDDTHISGARKRGGSPDQEGQDGMDVDQQAEPALKPSNIEFPGLNVGKQDGNTRLQSAPRDALIIQHLDIYVLTLFNLIPLFMELSLDISRAMGNITDKWIDLAVQFMFQSALERLQQMPTTSRSSDPITQGVPPAVVYPNFAYRTWIEECFAWGSTKQPSSTPVSRLQQELKHQNSEASTSVLQDRLHVEDLISAMFNSSVHILSDDEKILTTLAAINVEEAEKQERERFAWQRNAHQNALLRLFATSTPGVTPGFGSAVEELCGQYPVQPFLLDLIKYVEHMWRANMYEEVSGKPVLVQIEEGGLEGLNGAEFGEFLSRCGLKMNRNGDIDEGGVRVRWGR